MISIGEFLYNTETAKYDIKDIDNVVQQCSFGTKIVIEGRIYNFLGEYGYDIYTEEYLIAEVTKVPIQGLFDAYEYKTVLFLLKMYFDEGNVINFEVTPFKRSHINF